MNDVVPYIRDGRVPLADTEHEAFAAALVKHGGCRTPAFCEVWPEKAAQYPRGSLWVLASRLANLPDVDARYNALRNESLARVNVSLASLVQDLHDIATADPSEIVRTVVVNCRYCNGDGFRYQWVNEDEFCNACDDVQRDNDLRREQSKTGRTTDKPLPTCDGGFGFAARGEVHPGCPSCLGAGHRVTLVTDTTELSPKARKLFKGVKETANGIEVLMHDQQAARDMLHRMAGAYRDGAKLPGDPGTDPGEAIDMETITPANAKDAYMALVHGDA